MNGYTLRVSVLENCQLRCGYCLPDADQKFLSKKYWLKLSHYEKLTCVLKNINLNKIRFTGGEPLLRPDLALIISLFAQNLPHVPLALTTNGLGFNNSMARDLKQAGLSQITFHIDSLREDRYEKIMGKGKLSLVLEALERAQDLGFNIKINTVVQKNQNSDELLNFLLFSKKSGVEVRFIEIMNTGSAKKFVEHNFMSGQDILDILALNFKIRPIQRLHKSDPAEVFFIDDLALSFGLIASDTRPFCKNCNRLRLSADGRLHTCLYDNLGAQLNFDLEDKYLLAQIEEKIAQKTSLHPDLKTPRRIFSMSQIGG